MIIIVAIIIIIIIIVIIIIIIIIIKKAVIRLFPQAQQVTATPTQNVMVQVPDDVPVGVPVHAEGGKVTVQASGTQGVHATMVLEPVPGTGYPPRKEEEECPSYFNLLTLCYLKALNLSFGTFMFICCS